MIVVLHRERSEKLARHFSEALSEASGMTNVWPDLETKDQECVVQAFDSLIQDGLIGEREPSQ